jgi:hypothetical protein
MTVSICKNLNEIITCWNMVYGSYVKEGIISQNEFGIHTSPELLDEDACVFGYKNSDTITSTFSLSLNKFSLSKIWTIQDPEESVEFCLFSSYSANYKMEMLEMFRHAFWYSYYKGVTNFYLGVHPHHVAFYKRLHFDPVSETMYWKELNNKPVVILHGDLKKRLENDDFRPIARGIWENPVPKEFFDSRLIISKETIAGSVVEKYLAKPDKKS